MKQRMQRLIAIAMLRAAMVFLALAGAGCVAAGTGPKGNEIQPRDLTPVTWLEAPPHPPVEIVRDGKALAVVYVADPNGRRQYDAEKYRVNDSAPPPALMRLVHELVEVVQRGTGATLPFVEQPPVADQPAVVIGDCEEARRAGIDASQLPVEGFVVKTAPNRVYLVGSTEKLAATQHPRAAGSNGTAWAVADFLERFVGVRWYWPAEYGGRSVPRSSSLVIPPVDYRDEPVFHERLVSRTNNVLVARSFEPENHGDHMPLPFAPGIVPGGDAPDSHATQLYIAPHLPLMRQGGSLPYESIMHGARVYDLPRQAGNEALLATKADGTRNPRTLCYSNPGTLDFMVDACRRVWEKKGGAWVGFVGPTCVNVWTPWGWDKEVACHCPACRATAAKGGEELVINLFVKRLCDKVKQRWPGKMVVYNVWNTEPSKGLEYPDNLIVHHMNLGAMGLMHQPAVRRAEEARLRAWNGRRTTLWASCFRVTDWTYGPVQYPHVVQDFYLKNRDTLVGTYLVSYSAPFWVTSAPTWYVWMRVLWNPQLDVDAVLNEMCRRLFGKGAQAARELMELQCQRWEGTVWSRTLTEKEAVRDGWEGRLPDDLFRENWPPEVVARMKSLRDKALAEMRDDPDARKAFLYWTWTFDAFLAQAEAIENKDSVTAAPSAAERKAEAPRTPADLPPTLTLDLGGGVNMKLALIPAGEFLMGSPAGEPLAGWGCHEDEKPQHRVRLTKPYYMGIYEVTQAQYEAVMGTNPSGSRHTSWGYPRRTAKGKDRPVDTVSWNDAAEFCRKLSQKTGKSVRLPTEAQWEYACRAGTTTKWCCGDREDALHEYAWYNTKSYGASEEAGVHDVGGKRPNAWGLYDMHGNVHEWCQDWYGEYYYRQSPAVDPAGPATGLSRVLRGGSGNNMPGLCRSARRNDGYPVITSSEAGFRVVVPVEVSGH